MVPIFDFDGTLVDSDRALQAAFLRLGVPAQEITFGHALGEECARLGIAPDAYEAVFDPQEVQPYLGIDEFLGTIDQWGICSNRHPLSGNTDVARFGWQPSVVCFADSFDFAPKHIDMVLEGSGWARNEVVYIGDSEHDRAAIAGTDIPLIWAGWNPRTATTISPQSNEYWCVSPALLGRFLLGGGLRGR